MKKSSLFIVFAILLFTSIQCTEDDTVEASVSQPDIQHVESGEEGADGTDNDKDEEKN